MRNFLCFLCLFFFMLFCPALADNINHQAEWEMETVIEMQESNPAFSTMSKQKLFEDDIKGYYADKSSYYGGLLYFQNECKKKPDNDLEKKYINLIISNYETAIKNNNVSFLKPVYIKDSEYDKLSDEFKNALAMYNFLAGAIKI